MLYLLREGQAKALPLEPSTQGFTEAEFRTLVNCLPDLLGEDLMVLDYELGGSTTSGSRAGILALNRAGRKFVVELRQGDADGTELNALERAARFARATVADLAGIYAASNVHQGERPSPEAAMEEITQFLEEGHSDNGHDSDPTIVVLASDFRPEFRTTATWLKNRGLDISCLRSRGYHVADSWVIDVEDDAPFVQKQERLLEVTTRQSTPPEPEPDLVLRDESAEVPAEPPAQAPEEPPTTQEHEDVSATRYPLLGKVRELLSHWRPQQEVVVSADALVFPTEQQGVFFTLSVHTHPEPMVEMGLRFELESLNLNRGLAKRVLDQRQAIESALGESLDVQDPWYRSWVRVSVHRSYDPFSTVEAAEAAEMTAEFLDALMPHLQGVLEGVGV